MRATKEISKNKGITLIALVITIVLMMILAGVTIKIATDGGLFDKAKDAVGQTENAIKKEQQLVNDILDEYFKPNSSEDNTEEEGLPAGLKVGDYVNYTPTPGTYKVASGANGSGYTSEQSFTTETGEAALKWRVLSIDEENGEVELVAATQSSTKLYLQGADGYNHAVDILNDMCKELYSNENGATARSIKVEDINAKTTYDYTEYTDSSTGLKYGDTKQLSTYGTGKMKYPNLYSQEKGYGSANTFNTSGLNGSDGKKDGVTDGNVVTTYSTVTGYTDGNTAGTDPYITYTCYKYNAENYLNTNLGVNTAPAGLITTGINYWLASRCVRAGTKYSNFFVRYLYSDGSLDSRELYESDDGIGEYGYAVRPVVSLGSNVTLTIDTEKTTDEVVYWNIAY